MAQVTPGSAAEQQFRVRDPGLQGERTALAWSRTSLALFANGLLTLRTGWINGESFITALAGLLLFGAVAMGAYGRFRRGQLIGLEVPSAPPAFAMGTAALFSIAACLVGLAICLLRHS